MASTDEGAVRRARKERTPIPRVLFRRLGARLLDAWVVALVLILTLGPVIETLVLGSGVDPATSDRTVYANLATTTLTVGGLVLYHTLLESRTGQTLGKRLLRLRVTGADGGRPSVREAFRRNAFYLLIFLPLLGRWFLLGAVAHAARTARNDPDLQGWHDIFAGGTLVAAAAP